MSKAQREAFVDGAGMVAIREGVEWCDQDFEDEANDRYPDSPLGNVRECMVQLLKDNGYDGLWCPESATFVKCEGCSLPLCGLCLNSSCRPGVLVDGKIVEKEGVSA